MTKMDRAREAQERARRAADTNALGPGTAGYTTSGAAYRGKDVADAMGVPGPAEPGFEEDFGLEYNDARTPPPPYPVTGDAVPPSS